MGVFAGSKNARTGEPKTGFIEGDGKGPFKCGNCVHMKGGVCMHPVMIADSGQPKAKGGVKVDDDDCCAFQRRPGD